MTICRGGPDREAAGLPCFCALRTAGSGIVRATGPTLAALVFLVGGISAGSTGRPAVGSFTSAPGAGVQEDRPALPGLSTSGTELSEATRPPGGPGSSGRARRVRGGSFPFRMAVAPAAGSGRLSGLELERLEFVSGLYRARLGISSFHCGTPPPFQRG